MVLTGWTSVTWGVNWKAPIRFFDDDKRLPGSYHLGVEYEPSNTANISLEGVYRRVGLANLRSGLEWKLANAFVARVGYLPTPIRAGSLPFSSKIAAEFKFRIGAEKICYAWAPLHQRGGAHYLSITTRFGRK